MASAQLRNTLLAAGLLVGLAGAAFVESPWGERLQLDSVPAAPADAPQLHVLFIGNSYTSTNNLPAMLHAIAATDSITPVDIETAAYTAGGALLDQSWHTPAAQALLAARHWDHVVLQEESLMTTRPDLVVQARLGFGDWAPAIRAAGAVPVVLETWARQPGSADYGNATATAYHLTDAAHMQSNIDWALGDVAGGIGALRVPAGDAWMRCEINPATPDLYQADGAHPSMAGTYLAALTLYHQLTGHAPGNSSFVPAGLSADQARGLALCAAG